MSLFHPRPQKSQKIVKTVAISRAGALTRNHLRPVSPSAKAHAVPGLVANRLYLWPFLLTARVERRVDINQFHRSARHLSECFKIICQQHAVSALVHPTSFRVS